MRNFLNRDLYPKDGPTGVTGPIGDPGMGPNDIEEHVIEMTMSTLETPQLHPNDQVLLKRIRALEKMKEQLESEVAALGRDLDAAQHAIRVGKEIIKHEEKAAFTHFGKKVIRELLYSVLDYENQPNAKYGDIPF